MSLPVAGVPAPYRGLWERLLLEDADGSDQTSRVYWLQAGELFCDLRVPAGRPHFHGVDALAACSDEQLRWMLGQQGFAGRLRVEQNLFHWQRVIDFQPDQRVRDVGRMVFGAQTVEEFGVHAAYREVWKHTPPCATQRLALELIDEQRDGQSGFRRGFLIVVGEWFMFALDRREPIPQAASLQALVAADASSRAAMVRLLDFEISFGQRGAGDVPWAIRLSTLPFREGRPLLVPGQFEAAPQSGVCIESQRGIIRRWRVSEWTPGFHWF